MSGIRRLRKALAFSPWRPPHHLAAILNLFLEDYSQINLAPRRFQVEKKSFCRLLLFAITILYDVSECISSSPIFPLMVHYSYLSPWIYFVIFIIPQCVTFQSTFPNSALLCYQTFCYFIVLLFAPFWCFHSKVFILIMFYRLSFIYSITKSLNLKTVQQQFFCYTCGVKELSYWCSHKTPIQSQFCI